MTRNVAINIIIVALGTAVGLGASIKPWQVYDREKRGTEAQVVEMQHSEAKREELLKSVSRLRSSIGQEELARKNGYLAPGEVRAPPTPQSRE